MKHQTIQLQSEGLGFGDNSTISNVKEIWKYLYQSIPFIRVVAWEHGTTDHRLILIIRTICYRNVQVSKITRTICYRNVQVSKITRTICYRNVQVSIEVIRVTFNYDLISKYKNRTILPCTITSQNNLSKLLPWMVCTIQKVSFGYRTTLRFDFLYSFMVCWHWSDFRYTES